MVRVIPLTQGFQTIIDEEDWSKVQGYKWYAACTNRRMNRFYAVAPRKIGCGVVFLHRLLLPDIQPNQRLVHVNGNSLDNQKSNLCLFRNSGCRQKDRVYAGKEPSSKFRGVCVTRSCGKQEINAHIVFNGYPVFLGIFASEESAAKFYDHAARVLLTRPCLNFPDFFSERLLEQAEQRLVARGIKTEKRAETQA
jgi:hypothetical protein